MSNDDKTAKETRDEKNREAYETASKSLYAQLKKDPPDLSEIRADAAAVYRAAGRVLRWEKASKARAIRLAKSKQTKLLEKLEAAKAEVERLGNEVE